MDEVMDTVLEMEEKLKQDAQGAYKKELLDRISDTRVQVKKAMDTGLPTEEFQVMERLKKALDAADAVIQRAWEGLHG